MAPSSLPRSGASNEPRAVHLAAYGGIFVAGSLAWGIVMDGFRPDRYDNLGAAICLVGVAVIMFAPRPA